MRAAPDLAATGAGVTPEQVALVETSLDRLRPRLAEIARDFSDRFFAADRDAAALFSADPEQHRRSFLAELEPIVRMIRRHPDFLSAARALGARHRTYGVRAGHYRNVGPALLAALAAASGDEWTDELAEAWRLAFHLTAETMMAGAPGAPQAT